jgi:uncharacterized protein
VVRRILAAAGTRMPGLIGNTALLRTLQPQSFADDRFGVPTVTDILHELEKPGRDPRPAFKTAAFAEGVETMADLTPGMVLEGSVTNVAAFGAFVDIGVHQDGLVHVSAMSRNFVSDPREVAKPGDVVRVKVLGVDIPRKRISLTMRLDDEPDDRGADSSSRTGRGSAATSRERAPAGAPRPGPPDRPGGPQRGADEHGSRHGRAGHDEGGNRRGGHDEGGTQRGGQRGAGQREGDQRGDNRRNEPPGNSAMADALRRAGLAGGASGGAGSAGNGKPSRDDGRRGR